MVRPKSRVNSEGEKRAEKEDREEETDLLAGTSTGLLPLGRRQALEADERP